MQTDSFSQFSCQSQKLLPPRKEFNWICMVVVSQQNGSNFSHDKPRCFKFNGNDDIKEASVKSKICHGKSTKPHIAYYPNILKCNPKMQITKSDE